MRAWAGSIFILIGLQLACTSEQPINCNGPVTLIPSSENYCNDADAIARCLMEKGDHGVAAAIFSGLLDSCGGSVNVMLNLTNCLFKLERWDEASTMAHKAFGLDRTNVKARYNLAITERAVGNYESAMNVIRTTPTAETDRDFQFLAFQLAWELDDSAACYDHIHRAIAIAPEDKVLQLRLAARLMYDLQIEEAEAIAFRLHDEEPDTTEFHFDLVEWIVMYHLQTGDTLQACRHTIELAKSMEHAEAALAYAKHCQQH